MFETSVEDGIEVVELAHGKANAMDLEFCTGLADLLERLEAEGRGAVILAGRGAIFSAGVDLLRLLGDGPAYAKAFVPALIRMARALFTFRRPLVAAVNGHAIAGGCVMACTADVRVMAEGGGRIGVPELLVGVPFPAVALEAMREATTPAAFRTLVFEGRLLDGATARTWGLIDEVVPADRLRAVAQAHAARLSQIPADVFAITKMQARRPALDRIDALDAAHGAEVLRHWSQPATLATVRSYVERTFKPASRS